MFCPKCGSIMIAQSKNGKKISVCKCGYSSKEKIEPLKEIIKQTSQEIKVVETEKETLPLTDAECPKCKNNKAFYWTVQTRAADEGETKFLKCEQCKHTWRDYG
jgi:transcription factor S